MGFEIGDIIRNKKPYFGEPVKRIVDEDLKSFCVVWGPGKYGIKDDLKYREVVFKDQTKHYRLTNIIEISFLYCLGCLFLGWNKIIKWMEKHNVTSS